MIYISVNRHVILGNKKHGTNNPPLRVATGKRGHKVLAYRHSVSIPKASKLVYQPNEPLSCGARLWIETDKWEEA